MRGRLENIAFRKKPSFHVLINSKDVYDPVV